MDAGYIKPVSTLAQTVTSQTQYAMRAAAANETELPAEQAVTAVEESDTSAKPREERERRDELPLKRENLLDDETNTLIFRATDPDTGEVVRQIPEEALLRLRQALASQAAANAPFSSAGSGTGTSGSGSNVAELSVNRTL
ncbi:flagellar protein FlaG [Breoghania sp. JC706]|uniref:flagellar protein FlaG n=1 Tax=Breoghania sp. JC706 TaxID=3117732 RepID=UPI003009B0E8